MADDTIMAEIPGSITCKERDPESEEALPRRSTRRQKPSARTAQSPEQPLSETAMAELQIRENHSRRNPKRKASETAKNTVKLPDRPLEHALSPLGQQDIEEWEGWNELESEPAFFNVILKDLGVENIKAQEIFSIDQASLDMLPKPVHGLIFLYQYLPENDEDEEETTTSNVWFANQTIPNACATVALLNIVMNADVKLGSRLQDFKDSTRDLSTPLRGHRLSTDPFIRTIHNSFTRRMNQLNADLFLEQEAAEAVSLQHKKRSTAKKLRPSSRKKAALEYGFHFVAYVEVDKSVWELDGLKSKPHLIGHVPDGDGAGDWTTVAQPQIQARMLQYEGTQLSFNLLALCQSPLQLFSKSIAETVASLRYVREQMAENPIFVDLVSAEQVVLDLDDGIQLGELGLTRPDILSADVPQSLKDSISYSVNDVEKAYGIFQQLTIEAKSAIGEYRAEIMAMKEEERRVEGRKQDYGAALHRWVQSLAEKGLLEEIIKSSSQ